MMVNAVFPTFKVDNPDETAKAWHWALQEYPADAVLQSFQIYIKSNSTAFAPSVAQIIDGIYTPQDRELLSEGDAWALVKRAIQDGAYSSVERFNELPEIVQKAVGSPNMIYQWSQTDSNEVNTVVMSNFQRNYRTIVKRKQEDARISPMLESVTRKAIEGSAG